MISDPARLILRIRWLDEIVHFLRDYARSLMEPPTKEEFTSDEEKYIIAFIQLMDDCCLLSEIINTAMDSFKMQLIHYSNSQKNINMILNQEPGSFLNKKKIVSHNAVDLNYPIFEMVLVQLLNEARMLYSDYYGDVPRRMETAFKNIKSKITTLPSASIIYNFLYVHTQWCDDIDDWFHEQHLKSDEYDNWFKDIKQGIFANPPFEGDVCNSGARHNRVKRHIKTESQNEAPESPHSIVKSPEELFDSHGPSRYKPIEIKEKSRTWNEFVSEVKLTYHEINGANEFRTKSACTLRTIDAVNIGLRQMGKRVALEFAEDPQGIYWAVLFKDSTYALLPRRDMVIRAAHLEIGDFMKYFECIGFQPGCNYAHFEVAEPARVEIGGNITIKLMDNGQGKLVLKDPM